MQTVMQTLTTLLGNLRYDNGEDPAVFERALHILESLASVRSAVILVEMATPPTDAEADDDGDADDERDEPLVQMFETLLNSIQ